ncbi:hypothetical protein ACJ73_05570 [Blastomyces percursus]|uniref:Uncharacterized protein n=1 Tax=Blastomyces percursus TaxID=1658174 RepID=A0A1J9Q3E8_9EURO|nr:hypothetical protein ACJ73_05570 [Blastomyces percursus]
MLEFPPSGDEYMTFLQDVNISYSQHSGAFAESETQDPDYDSDSDGTIVGDRQGEEVQDEILMAMPSSRPLSKRLLSVQRQDIGNAQKTNSSIMPLGNKKP